MATAGKGKIRIEQTLHGYADGHRLLQSSTALSPANARLMLVLSDITGPSPVSGFESYLTGYLLPEGGQYALATTWLAPEMDRPGCVWTHTLLIAQPDLARIGDLRCLRRLFRRATSKNDWSDYAESIETSADDIDGGLQEKVLAQSGFLAELLLALYDTRQGVIVASKAATRPDDVILALWSQQWPRLRRSFQFCTGVFTGQGRRSIIPFDLEVVPSQMNYQVAKGPHEATVIGTGHAGPSQHPTWVSRAIEDLREGSSGRLRHFLWRFGSDAPGDRSAFVPLVKARMFIDEINHGQGSPEPLISLLAERFPRPSDAGRLKLELLAEEKSADRLMHVSDVDIVSALATTPHWQAFEQVKPVMRRRGRSLWAKDRLAADPLLKLLLRTEVNELGAELLSGMAEALDPIAILDLAATRTGLLYLLTKQNPKLLLEPTLWRASPEQQCELVDAAVAASSADWVDVKTTVKAALEAGAVKAAEKIITRTGGPAVFGTLDWLDKLIEQDSVALSEPLTRALRGRTQDVVAWLIAHEPHVKTLVVLVTLLDPHSPEVLGAGAELWLRLSARTTGTITKTERVDLMAFLLAIAFDNTGPGAEELAARTFQCVDDAAASDRLSYRAWRHLEPYLPSLSWWRDWDKCERLRRGLVERVLRRDWPVETLFAAAQRKESFRRVIEILDWTRDGRDLLDRAMAEVRSGTVLATDWQREILRWW